MGDINVLMTVDTVKLLAGEPVENCCVLSDDNGDQPGSVDFTIEAKNKDTVAFTITPSTCSFVDFDKKKGSKQVFAPLPKSNNNWTGRAKGSKGDAENFNIEFSLQGIDYLLDPQIKIKAS